MGKDKNVVIQEFDTLVSLHGPSGYIGDLNVGIQLTDVCYQIWKNKLTGYYVMDAGVKIDISRDGKLAKPLSAIEEELNMLLKME